MLWQLRSASKYSVVRGGEWVGKEMKENRPWFDNCELRKLSVLPLHAMATTWVGSLLPGLWLHFLKLNDATKHSDSKGFLHKPLGSVKTWAACLWICIPGTWQAARCLAPYWHQNTGCLTSMLTIQSAQLRWQTLKRKLVRRKHCLEISTKILPVSNTWDCVSLNNS